MNKKKKRYSKKKRGGEEISFFSPSFKTFVLTFCICLLMIIDCESAVAYASSHFAFFFFFFPFYSKMRVMIEETTRKERKVYKTSARSF